MRLTRSKVFLFCLLAFVAGVGIASLISFELIYWYAAGLLAIVCLIVFWSSRNYKIMALLGLFFVAGGIRYAVAIPSDKNPGHIGYYNGQDVVITGVVAEEPDVRLDSQRLTVGIKNVETQHTASLQGISGRLLVKTNLYPQYQYGDELKIKCQIEAPGQIEDFAYDKYLARYDIYSVCWKGTIEKLGKGQGQPEAGHPLGGSPIMAGIFAVKNRFLQAINHSLPEPHASLLAGILIGARRGIPPYLLEAFSRVGITHIIAISGSNITIIAVAIVALMQGLGISRRYAFWLIAASIGVFVIMTGASASVVRAGVMGVFALLARQLGRASRATNALVFTAFVMLLINPKILVFDAGFQLSFLATAGLVYINPILIEHVKTWPEIFGLKEALITTVSAIIMTTPLILYQFGRFSLIAPLANILVVPLVPFVMAVGFAVGIGGLLFTALGQALGVLAWALLQYIVRVAEILSAWRLASLELGGFHWILMFAFYALIGWTIFRITNNQTPNTKKTPNNQ